MFELSTSVSSCFSNYRKVRLVARPWKTPEGTVNRPTLKMMLEAVMMFIMTKPGVTRGDLITKYNPLLHPVPLMELTEVREADWIIGGMGG